MAALAAARGALRWPKPPQTLLLVKKRKDDRTTAALDKTGKWLLERGVRVLVEETTRCDLPHFEAIHTRDTSENTFTLDHAAGDIDGVVTFGGDGTLLHVSSLFQSNPVPPVVSFSLGTLGFLTPFRFDDYPSVLSGVLEGSAPMVRRSRLTCSVRTATQAPPGSGEPPCSVRQVHALNELAVHRGAELNMPEFQLFCGGRLAATMPADGIIVSSATGSTAYALNAGGPMVHPSVEALLVVPISPRALSFRPLVLPHGVPLRVKVAEGSRCGATATFDGRFPQKLAPGDAVEVQESPYPLPAVSRSEDTTSDWVGDVTGKLMWGARQPEGAASPTGGPAGAPVSPLHGIAPVFEASEAAIACFGLLDTNFNDCVSDEGTSRAEVRLAIEREQVSFEDLKLLLDLGSGAAAEDDGALVARLVDMGLGLDELFALLKGAAFLQGRPSFCDAIGIAVRCRLWKRALKNKLGWSEDARTTGAADSAAAYAREVASLLLLGGGKAEWAHLQPLAKRARLHLAELAQSDIRNAAYDPEGFRQMGSECAKAVRRAFRILAAALTALGLYERSATSEIRTREEFLDSGVARVVLDPHDSLGTLAGALQSLGPFRRAAAALSELVPPRLGPVPVPVAGQPDGLLWGPARPLPVHLPLREFLASRLAAALVSSLRGTLSESDAAAVAEAAAVARQGRAGIPVGPVCLYFEDDEPPAPGPGQARRLASSRLLDRVSGLLAPTPGATPAPPLQDAEPRFAATAELFAGYAALEGQTADELRRGLAALYRDLTPARGKGKKEFRARSAEGKTARGGGRNRRRRSAQGSGDPKEESDAGSSSGPDREPRAGRPRSRGALGLPASLPASPPDLSAGAAGAAAAAAGFAGAAGATVSDDEEWEEEEDELTVEWEEGSDGFLDPNAGASLAHPQPHPYPGSSSAAGSTSSGPVAAGTPGHGLGAGEPALHLELPSFAAPAPFELEPPAALGIEWLEQLHVLVQPSTGPIFEIAPGIDIDAGDVDFSERSAIDIGQLQ
eukprot:tig00021037_g17465.t1